MGSDLEDTTLGADRVKEANTEVLQREFGDLASNTPGVCYPVLQLF
jgi:hypothetical protein